LAEHLKILIDGCRKGDPASQERLYRQFSAAMYGLCLQYASSEEDAQDILQDGFIKVFRKIKQVKEPRALPGWIRRIMINTALEKYRSQVVLERIDSTHEGLNLVEDDSILDRMSADTLVGLIQGLSPKYRMVFNLYAVEGYSHKEISDMLGISEGTSKSNLSRARAILQDKVIETFGSVNVK
jgi:RNA polymerase sigma-70 factor (ECF subfamily)